MDGRVKCHKNNVVTSKNDIEESEASSIVPHLVPIETFVAASPSFVLEQDMHGYIDDTKHLIE